MSDTKNADSKNAESKIMGCGAESKIAESSADFGKIDSRAKSASAAKKARIFAWIFLLCAIITEVLGSSFLKLALDMKFGFLVTALFICISYYFIALAIKHISVSVAYAMWEVLGVVFIVIIGLACFDEQISGMQFVGIGLAMSGIILINIGEVPLEECTGAESSLESSAKFSLESDAKSDIDSGAKSHAVDSRILDSRVLDSRAESAQSHATKSRQTHSKPATQNSTKTAPQKSILQNSTKARPKNLAILFAIALIALALVALIAFIGFGADSGTGFDIADFSQINTERLGVFVGLALVFGAALLDVIANLLLKASQGFSKWAYGVGAILVVVVAFYLLMCALRFMELAIAYSSWGAIGIIGTIIGGRVFFGERLNAIGYIGVSLVITAVVLLHI
ncbi:MULTISPECIES: DMT family transporter [unclassified Helicobacter]|uniref:DMT family transporter n=1 Tax=unclassified Helicobacter TaxID=2593540 RepID=UPI001F2909E8|nr:MULTISPECIES: multidrug efflux SMR transporter [unclassified Helicobacter]